MQNSVEPDVLWSLDSGDMCGWSVVALVQRDNEFAVYMESGCSCSSAFDSYWTEGLPWTRNLDECARQIRDEIRRLTGNYWEDISADEAAKARGELNRTLSKIRRARHS